MKATELWLVCSTLCFSCCDKSSILKNMPEMAGAFSGLDLLHMVEQSLMLIRKIFRSLFFMRIAFP